MWGSRQASPLTASLGTIAAMRLLAVFAHPDDELGCIGTLAKHARRGDAVLLAWTTHGELASQFTEDEASVRRIRQEHGATIAKLIGAEHHFFDMGDSMLTGSRREALQLARLYARFQPDAIITWSDDHPHPDHRMTARIAFDAVTLARIPKIINHDLSEPLAPHR
ncbi:MAG: PIG-L family deacetylase, partial [Truepera sp.]|nr:PIG-L family deacetylase [Truepera sp.]